MCMADPPNEKLFSRCAKHGGVGDSSDGCTVCHTTWTGAFSDNLSPRFCVYCSGRATPGVACSCRASKDSVLSSTGPLEDTPVLSSTGPFPTFTPAPGANDGVIVRAPRRIPFVCPVCDGTTKVSCPPYLAGDMALSEGEGIQDCPACKDTPGVVWG
jgi:hypothetical protein